MYTKKMEQVLLDVENYLKYLRYKIEKELKPQYYHSFISSNDACYP